jgi:hypothetical protein
MDFCSAPQLGRFHVLCDRSVSGVVALSLRKVSKAMTQHELNYEIARQTGESVAEIARHGFTILSELPQDDDDEPLPADVVATTADA